jgi:acid phosphatase (class A)
MVMIGALIAPGLSAALLHAAEPSKCSGQSDEPLVQLLAPPPCETCEKTKAELQELAKIGMDASSERKARASADVDMSLTQFLRGAGIAFEPEKLKACEGTLFKMLRRDEKSVLDAAKDAFCRTRPFKTAGTPLRAVAAGLAAGDNSYPSGHAAYGAAVGFLLADMLPEKKTAIYARIEDYAYSRLVLGVHFRSDVEAGKLLGAAVGATLISKPGFTESFEETKACVRKAAGLG